MYIAEILALQGVSIEDMPVGQFSDRQLGLVAGNAVPISLLKRVLKRLLGSAGLRQ